MTPILIVLMLIAVQMVFIFSELRKANVLAQQAITQRLAIAEKLAKIQGTGGDD